MKKLTLIPIVFITLLFTSCIKDLIEDVTEVDGPVLAEANADGYNYVSRAGTAGVKIYKDNSFMFTFTFIDADNLIDVLGDIHSLSIVLYGIDFNDVSNNASFSETHSIEMVDETNPKSFFGFYWSGNILNEEVNYFGVTGVEGSSGTFYISNHDASKNIISGTFTFTALDENDEEITISNGKIIDIEYNVEYSDKESLNDDIED